MQKDRLPTSDDVRSKGACQGRDNVQLKKWSHSQTECNLTAKMKFIERERSYKALHINRTICVQNNGYYNTFCNQLLNCMLVWSWSLMTRRPCNCKSSAAGKEELLCSPGHLCKILQWLDRLFLQWENLLHAFCQITNGWLKTIQLEDRSQIYFYIKREDQDIF